MLMPQTKMVILPLMKACNDSYLDLVRYLIDMEADVNVSDNVGWTPLMMVCHQKDIDAVTCLIMAWC